MNSFLAGIGAKLAERWATLLVLPGLIYLFAGTVAGVLGHRHALNVSWLASWIDRMAAEPVSASMGAILLVSAGVLSASAVAGLLASVLGRALEWAWHRPEGRRLSRFLTGRRRARWDREDARITRELAASVPSGRSTVRLPPAAVAALGRRDAVSLEPPAGPTWIGDRFRALTVRVRRAYALDLLAVWPRLWLLLPDPPRAEITAVQDSHAAAARLGGWALLYLILGAIWWPALLAAVVLGLTSWYRARSTAEVLAALIEAAVDLHACDLAAQLGLSDGGPVTRGLGRSIAELIEKSPETRLDQHSG
ncbi:hypothetical protein ACFWY5_52720 [Nonomuraea sp. NPDC059007]|uniref:hypothetical protein n=1 Tax=Nonomuraea sp. NPDC059007 TaxID=3346692 RepID=UPI0036A0427E